MRRVKTYRSDIIDSGPELFAGNKRLIAHEQNLLFAPATLCHTQSNLPFCLANDGGPVLRPPIDTESTARRDLRRCRQIRQAALPTDIRPSPIAACGRTLSSIEIKQNALCGKLKRSSINRQAKNEQVPIAPIPVSELLPIGNGKCHPYS